jgi:hypothetical protein
LQAHQGRAGTAHAILNNYQELETS